MTDFPTLSYRLPKASCKTNPAHSPSLCISATQTNNLCTILSKPPGKEEKGNWRLPSMLSVPLQVPAKFHRHQHSLLQLHCATTGCSEVSHSASRASPGAGLHFARHTILMAISGVSNISCSAGSGLHALEGSFLPTGKKNLIKTSSQSISLFNLK